MTHHSSPRLYKHAGALVPLLCAIAVPLLPIVPLQAASDSAQSQPVALVRANKAIGVVVVPENADASIVALAEYFVGLVERSSGAKIPVISEEAEAKLPPETTRLFLGPTRHAEAAGVRLGELPEEGYRIVVRENAIIVLGRDVPRKTGPGRSEPVSQPTRWALNRLAEEQLGVRWLWPGELGTYIPRRTDFVIPAGDISYQPKLRCRQLVPDWALRTARRDRPPTGRLTAEEQGAIFASEQETIQAGVDWLENHQCGERGDIPMPSHAFTKWWERYGKTNPDYFAKPPPGEKPALYRPGSIKLRISNPEVIEQIAKEYEKAGAPLYWPMTPNDAAGFDTSEETLAWDIPQGQPIMDIWKGTAKLTARYVTFWNRVHARLKEINPEVTLTAFAYSAYAQPPPPERPLTARMKMGIVPGYSGSSYDTWKGWADVLQDGGICLRPNWWWKRSNAPHLPLEEIAAYMKFTWENRLDAIRMDSINGFWGTKGPSYYLVARLMIRPDLNKEDVLSEYTSAFGKAAPKIREYLDYWQKVTSDQDNFVSDVPEVQEYLTSVKTGENSFGSSAKNSLLLPYLYPDAVINPGYKLLKEADALVGDNDPEARQRVAFLQSGLDELRLSRDTIALGVKASDPATRTPELTREFKTKATELAELRKALSARHVVWGGAVERREYIRNIPSLIRSLQNNKTTKAKPKKAENAQKPEKSNVGEDLNDL